MLADVVLKELLKEQHIEMWNNLQRLSKAYYKRNAYRKKQVEYTSSEVEMERFQYLVVEC